MPSLWFNLAVASFINPGLCSSRRFRSCGEAQASAEDRLRALTAGFDAHVARLVEAAE